jgi:HAE1 family hydrophobic/amphiphilic exporter-1
MLAATILTLALVPVFYAVIEQWRERGSGREPGSGSEPAPALEAIEAHAEAAE